MSPGRLVGLYPTAWRRRYGEEFVALLEDRPPTLLQVLDIGLGAVDAHLFPQAPEGRFRMFTRIAGLAALLAGLILVVGVFWTVPDEINAIRVDLFYVAAAIGLIGIHLRQLPARPALAWFGFLAAFAGIGMGIVGFALARLGVLPPSGGELGFFGGLALWIGSIALGASMLAIGRFPTVAGLAITLGAPLAMIGLVAGINVPQDSVLPLLWEAGIVVYGLGWVVAGLSLVAAQPTEGVLGQPA